MRKFKIIQDMLGNLPENIKKTYLLGSTGAGKTSLVQNIIGTSIYGFPTTQHRRTTVATTEYVIKKGLDFKTTIVLKKREDLYNSIYDLIQMAIIRASADKLSIDDIIFELEQTPDERFKLKYIISEDFFKTYAYTIFTTIIPLINENDEEDFFSKQNTKDEIKRMTLDFIGEIEKVFYQKCTNPYILFDDQPYIIDNITTKKNFIKKNKELLANDFGSISVLVEYVRIEGDLLADWFNKDYSFVLIDGEGLAHSLGEKRDTLSIRHHDYFNFCNNIILIENSNNPFITGGQGAIESIFLNGYKTKFKLVFSKTDKLTVSDTSGYFRRNIRNLSSALKKENIDFNIENKNTFKFSNLNKQELNLNEKKEIEKLINDIVHSKDSRSIPLEYDFNNLFINIDREKFIDGFIQDINEEHWAVIKALSLRLFRFETEYKHLKPISWILKFLMQEINQFLRRDDELQSEISDSQNIIKQNVSKKIIRFIDSYFIEEKQHLWKQAYDKWGTGSDHIRKEFILEQILKPFINENCSKKEIKNILLKSGANELKSAVKINLIKVDIKKIYGKINFNWLINENINILLGKNGSGKSTLLKLIDACINNNRDNYKHYEFPSVELTLIKEYDNGDKQKIEINNNRRSTDIKSILINTFDIFSGENSNNETDLDIKLKNLINEFGNYQRSLDQIFKKKTEIETNRFDEIFKELGSANQEMLSEFKGLKVKIDNVKYKINEPLNRFETIINSYFKNTNKLIILDDTKEPLLIKINETDLIKINQLSSGEKQLLIIFLTVTLQNNKPFILLMDEPETSLHVEWQSTLIDDIKKIKPKAQIIIATHNPLLALNRNENEISIVESNNEEIFTYETGSKHLDISSILLKYFKLPSLIGKDFQEIIKEFTKLKIQDNLSETDNKRREELANVLDNSFVGEIIYNENYFTFLKFLKKNKDIDFDDFEEIDEDEFQKFLSEFKEEYND